MTSSLTRVSSRASTHVGRASRYAYRGEDLACFAMPRSVVLSVEKLPRRYRLAVEALLVDALPSQPTVTARRVTAHDYDAEFFTRWYSDGPGTVGCEQLMTATSDEVRVLRRSIEELTRSRGLESVRISVR